MSQPSRACCLPLDTSGNTFLFSAGRDWARQCPAQSHRRGRAECGPGVPGIWQPKTWVVLEARQSASQPWWPSLSGNNWKQSSLLISVFLSNNFMSIHGCISRWLKNTSCRKCKSCLFPCSVMDLLTVWCPQPHFAAHPCFWQGRMMMSSFCLLICCRNMFCNKMTTLPNKHENIL